MATGTLDPKPVYWPMDLFPEKTQCPSIIQCLNHEIRQARPGRVKIIPSRFRLTFTPEHLGRSGENSLGQYNQKRSRGRSRMRGRARITPADSGESIVQVRVSKTTGISDSKRTSETRTGARRSLVLRKLFFRESWNGSSNDARVFRQQG